MCNIIRVFYSILFCTFMTLNLCQADSKVQHQNPIKKNHLSIAVAKSSTTEMPDKVGNAFLKRYDFNHFLKQARVRAEQTSSGKSFQTVGASKAKLWLKWFFFFIYGWTEWTELRNLQEPFSWTFVSCTISFTMSRQKRTKITGINAVKKLVN